MKRRSVFAAMAVVAAVLGAAAFFQPSEPLPDPATPENFALINEGMTAAAVGPILGPPGDYAVLPMQQTFIYWSCRPGKCEQRHWQGNQAKITLEFRDDVVVGKYFLVTHPEQQDVLDALIWQIERRLRRWLP